MSKELFTAMKECILNGDPEQAASLASQALAQGIDPLTAINQGFLPGVNEVGEQFSSGEMFLPELVMAGEAMKAAVAVLEPELARRGTERPYLGRIVIGTVAGDIHEIGKTLVATMLAANGFEVHDLGVDVPAQRFLDEVRQVGADVLGLSALLTTTILNQEAVIQSLEEAGLRDQVKVVIGGVPASPEWADEIGADGYAENAQEAVATALELVAG